MDSCAAETPAEAFARHLAAVDLRPAKPERKPVTLGPSGGVKRQMWANAVWGKAAEEKAGKTPRRPSGPRHDGRRPLVDYAAWCRELATLCAKPTPVGGLAKHFGISVVALRCRLHRASVAGHWPPKGMRLVETFEARGRKLVAVEAI